MTERDKEEDSAEANKHAFQLAAALYIAAAVTMPIWYPFYWVKKKLTKKEGK